MSAIAAVVFDFDGVIADTERLHLRAFQSAFVARGWTLTDTSYFATYLGFTDRHLVEEFARARGEPLAARDLTRLLDDKARAFEALLGDGDALLVPSAPACIERLAAALPLAIASGARGDEIRWLLDRAGLGRHFRTIVAAEDVARGKPSPDPYLEAVRRLGVEAAEAVAIEDSVWGLDSARLAGLRTIAVTHTYPADTLISAGCIVNSLDAVTPEFLFSLPGASAEHLRRSGNSPGEP